MAKYRAIQTDFWEDGFVLDLTPEEKYFYLYLLSNSRTTQCGCYELPYKVIEMQTGYNRETVEKLLQRFIEYEKIEYSANTKEILIKNWHKFNFTKSPKVMNCILKEISAIKNQDFKNHMIEVCIDYGYPMDTLSIAYPYSIHTFAKCFLKSVFLMFLTSFMIQLSTLGDLVKLNLCQFFTNISFVAMLYSIFPYSINLCISFSTVSLLYPVCISITL